MSTQFLIFGQAPMTREAILETPIGQLQECVLQLACFEGCERPATCALKPLAMRYGQRIQLRSVIRRLRCSGCRRPPAAVAISDSARTGPAKGFATWRIELIP